MDERGERGDAGRRLRTLIVDGFASGDPRELTDELIAELRERAFGQ